MAKRSTEPTELIEAVPEDTSSGTPVPPDKLHVTLTTLATGETLHRVHQKKYHAEEFNPGIQGNARFSPITSEHGAPIPTLYAGTTMNCALMETIFHDIPYNPGFKSIDKNKLVGQLHSVVQIEQEIQLVDLASVPLRKLGVTRKQLIDTEKDRYPATRKWAEAIHHQYPEAQGLSWVSRQDDSARAVMLFGDRIADDAIRSTTDSRSLLEDIDTYDAVLNLADRIGVNIVPGLEW